MNALETIASPRKGVVVRKSWQRQLLTFLMVVGPGLIVMEADNDAGAVSTYMQAGANYGLHLLWIMLVLLPITIPGVAFATGDRERAGLCRIDVAFGHHLSPASAE